MRAAAKGNLNKTSIFNATMRMHRQLDIRQRHNVEKIAAAVFMFFAFI